MYVIKKDGTREEFNVDKIIAAVNKSAARILYEFSTDEIAFICQFAYEVRKWQIPISQGMRWQRR